MSIEYTDKRFGVVAIEKGFISLDQLLESLKMQIEEELERGIHRVIGAILVENGFMDLLQIEEVLDSM
ncbi:hypothetical protein ACFL7E_04155 [Thermodesulfobacteriota bacterium]